MTPLLLIFVGLLAFANGANDNCKGVATLVGYGAAKPRQALLWATLTTAMGSVFSFFVAGGLIKSFSTGLFARGTPLDQSFFLAVVIGAFGWVIFATRTGLPVSTTHAITGALTGAGWVSFGPTAFQWDFLGAKFALPLAASPLLSLVLVYLLAWPVVGIMAAVASKATGSPLPTAPDASETPAGGGASESRVANGIHWISSGLVGFARGWNDAPKITALSLVALDGPGGVMLGFAVVTVAMALGGLLAGRRVLETLSQKVTALPLAESLTASLTTAVLVGMASWNSLPVSTTHVSTGAIVGAGLKHDRGGVHWSKVGEIVLSWLVTLPVAALLAGGVKALLR